MSALQTQLTEDMKNAMRAHESLKLNTIRFMISALKNWQIDNRDTEVTDAIVQSVIAKEVKKNQDALVDFKNAGRDDIVAEEEEKLKIMQSYLPQQMSDEELEAIVKEVVDTATDKNFGVIMKAVMAKAQGKADGGRVSAMVKQVLV